MPYRIINFSKNPFTVIFKMEKRNLETQKARLKKVSNKEWLDAMDKVKRLIAWRLYGCKQCSGAHSEMALGLPAEDYYVGEAV